jgi:hypothetical protein
MLQTPIHQVEFHVDTVFWCRNVERVRRNLSVAIMRLRPKLDEIFQKAPDQIDSAAWLTAGKTQLQVAENDNARLF